MREFKNGTLRSSDGKKVTSRKQALAIAISESEDYAEKADLISAIHIGSVREAEEILKAAGTEGDLFEKAKPGDEREYQGRMYVYGTTKSGKMGWRVKEKLKRGSSGASAGSGTTKTTEKEDDKSTKKASDQKSDVTIKKLDDASDGSVIKITTAQTGSNIVTFTKKDGKWYSKNTMTRGEVKASSKQVLNSIEKYNKKSYKQTVNLKAGKTSEVNEETLKKQLKEFGGKLLGLQTKDGVIGIGVQFEPRDYYAADNFVKKHKEWRATTNVDNNYEFVYLNKEGVEALRKRGFQNLPDVSNKTNSTSQKKQETASAAKKKTPDTMVEIHKELDNKFGQENEPFVYTSDGVDDLKKNGKKGYATWVGFEHAVRGRQPVDKNKMRNFISNTAVDQFLSVVNEKSGKKYTSKDVKIEDYWDSTDMYRLYIEAGDDGSIAESKKTTAKKKTAEKSSYAAKEADDKKQDSKKIIGKIDSNEVSKMFQLMYGKNDKNWTDDDAHKAVDFLKKVPAKYRSKDRNLIKRTRETLYNLIELEPKD